ncbi:MAG: SRPBCC family protein [Eudoraea sp.]|uniref:CoxG family protein n=1 Tax=Eudoraea sp. TaxID=1979955 RepID=UPI003C76DBE0
MKTQLDKSFEVPQSTDLVWEHLIDPEKIMDCVPGVSIDEKVADNHYKGKVGMKFGPMGVKYDADIHYNEIDKANRKIIITGEGVDSKGNGNAEMMMTIDLIERAEGGVKLDAIMDVTVNGKIAQFGSRLITTVSNQLFKQFVSNFSKKLAAAEAATSA